MPYAGEDFERFDPRTVRALTFDFSARGASATDAISEAAWSLISDPMAFGYTASDESPAGKLSDSKSDDTTTTVTVGPGLVANARYRLVVSVTLASGAVDDLWCYLHCDPDPTA